MNAPLRQAGRIGRLSTILGPDELVLLRFDGADHLNDLFEYRVEALSANRDIDFDSLMGTHATVTLDAKDERHFDGIVTRARWTGAGENGHRYDLILRPWFWLAGRRRNQRIFHNKTVVQILQELLGEYAALGDPALELALTGDYPELEYTVQYRESDLDFARRQMERHGISFYFKHAEGSHTLVLTDDVASHKSIGERKFFPHDGHHMAEEEHFWEWAPERNLTTGAVRLTDFNFKTPMAAMEVDRLGDAAHAQGQIESFDYPGDYLERGRGKSVAGLRTDGERGGDRRYRAAGDCLSLGAGMQVSLGGEQVPGTGEAYVVLSANYHFVSEAYGSGSPANDGYSFTGAWTVMPASAPMMPPRRTFVPTVQGPQTAMVVGEGEIDCDEYGRILVRFHWDLAGAHSMRCRVSQNWAGAGWGGMVIPRIGMEVLVEFLEGDPDKPLVTGNVFNGKNDAPYPLPANKTRSTFRTNTHDGKGTGRGFNELRFEDEQGEEEIYLHAQKDRNEKTLNNHSERIDNSWLQSVGHNKVLEVKNNQNEAIGGDYFLSVGPSSIGTLVSLNFLGNSEGIKQATDGLGLLGQIVPGLGNMSVFVDKAKVETVGFTSLETVGTNKSIVTGVDFGTSAGKNTHLSTGQKFQIVAGKEFEIVCGKSRFVMLEDGTVKILGNNFYFSSYDDFIILGKDVKIN